MKFIKYWMMLIFGISSVSSEIFASSDRYERRKKIKSRFKKAGIDGHRLRKFFTPEKIKRMKKNAIFAGQKILASALTGDPSAVFLTACQESKSAIARNLKEAKIPNKVIDTFENTFQNKSEAAVLGTITTENINALLTETVDSVMDAVAAKALATKK